MVALPRHTIGWTAGFVASLLGIGMILDQITFDRELLSTEARVISVTDSNDRRIIEQLLDTQRLFLAQQQQQFLTLRREILDQQIAVMRQQYEHTPPDTKPLALERLRTMEHKLDEIDKQLQTIILKPKPMTLPPDW